MTWNQGYAPTPQEREKLDRAIERTARKWGDRSIRDDLIAAAEEQLLIAQRRYRPADGPFVPYARKYFIRPAILREARCLKYPHLSEDDFEERPRILQAVQELRQSLHKDPTDEHVADLLGLSIPMVRRVRTHRHASTLDSFRSDEEDREVQLPSDEPTVEEASAVIRSTLGDLPDGMYAPDLINAAGLEWYELFAFVRHKGLDGEQPESFSSIGRALGVSKDPPARWAEKAEASLKAAYQRKGRRHFPPTHKTSDGEQPPGR